MFLGWDLLFTFSLDPQHGNEIFAPPPQINKSRSTRHKRADHQTPSSSNPTASFLVYEGSRPEVHVLGLVRSPKGRFPVAFPGLVLTFLEFCLEVSKCPVWLLIVACAALPFYLILVCLRAGRESFCRARNVEPPLKRPDGILWSHPFLFLR